MVNDPNFFTKLAYIYILFKGKVKKQIIQHSRNIYVIVNVSPEESGK